MLHFKCLYMYIFAYVRFYHIFIEFSDSNANNYLKW